MSDDLAERVPSEFVAKSGEEYMLKFEDLHVGPKIGGGAFSTVHTGTWNGADVAIKVVKAQEDMSKYMASELAILGYGVRTPWLIRRSM
jgi:predicted unusual protein kinase regulating ubiquinone biosynthesis (AarF/ABC1/UbiB family)